MANKKRFKNKAGGGQFIPLPRKFLTSDSLASLSIRGRVLFFDLLAQYNGFNNGALSMAWKLMKKRQWGSKSMLQRAKEELLEKSFIMLTRQGGKHQCSLYALTLYGIDSCPGKNLEIAPTTAPVGGWLK